MASPERATQTIANAGFVSPLQGWQYHSNPKPRALPWAFLFGPFGAEIDEFTST